MIQDQQWVPELIIKEVLHECWVQVALPEVGIGTYEDKCSQCHIGHDIHWVVSIGEEHQEL